MPPKKDKKKVLKQKQKQKQKQNVVEKQTQKENVVEKQTQNQNVVVNITAPVAKRTRARRPKKEVEPRKQLPVQRPHVFFTAQPAPAPSYNQPAPQPQPLLRQSLPLSFYDTSRPMNMGFDFVRPQPEPIATQTETDIIPTLTNQLDDNAEVVNSIDEEEQRLFDEQGLIGGLIAPSPNREEKVRNPKTGSLIKLGGTNHKKLIDKGILDEIGEPTPTFSRYLDKYGDPKTAYNFYISDIR
jgi:hypothetical protein